MNVRRGEVVLVDFPFPSGAGTKVRPALVIQNDRDNVRLLNAIIVQITGTTYRSLEATQVLIETSTVEGKKSGLAFDSVVNCVNLVTVEQSRILRKLGQLPEATVDKVNSAVKVAMALR